MIIGVDTGGTFTDLVFLEAGRIRIRKVPSTPDDPSRAILHGLALEAPEPGFSLAHGTTVATNALLERRGARTALLTTQGCRDVLEIGRQTRAELYSLTPTPRDPLVPRALRFEVPERMDWRGKLLTPLDEAAVSRVLDACAASGVESLAVCFLFSFLRPDHEQAAGRLARARGLSVSLSHEVAPEFREFERTSTVCANAYVGPVMARYIAALQERLREAGAARLSVMQSNGGALRAEEAAAGAVKTVLSGPAGGVVAAARVARAAGFDRLLTFDMGGTSTDVALVDREPRTMRSGEVAGLPLLTPMLDIHTVGAGGGSLARIDSGGALRVGPESAGADPGPVAYGRGEQLTVTDANVLLGRLPAAVRLGGELALDVERVRRAFASFAERIGRTPEAAAEGVLRVVNASMARALRHISTERGHDPADYALVSFGGAGGLHGCDLAEELGMRTVLVPRFPGAFSALGLALADVRREAVRSFFTPATEEALPAARAELDRMAAAARGELRSEGILVQRIRVERFLEMRYVGQSYALEAPFRGSMERAAAAFHRAHRARFGIADPAEPVEVVALGVRATGSLGVELPAPELPETPGRPLERVRVYVGGGWRECPLFERADLAAGQRLEGPVLMAQEDATTLISPGWRAEADVAANLILRRMDPA